MRASKEILANEIGVGFRRAQRGDAELGGTEGSIEGGTFHFRAAHFELLVRMARQFGLDFAELGKRRCGTTATLFFCDELLRLYAHQDYASLRRRLLGPSKTGRLPVSGTSSSRGGSAIVSDLRMTALNMGFFTWHARLEANHARHTWQELEELLREAARRRKRIHPQCL